MERIEQLTVGMPIVWGGDKVSRVDEDLTAAFRPGDSLIVMQSDGSLLHVPASEQTIATDAVDAASDAFGRMSQISDAGLR